MKQNYNQLYIEEEQKETFLEKIMEYKKYLLYVTWWIILIFVIIGNSYSSEDKELIESKDNIKKYQEKLDSNNKENKELQELIKCNKEKLHNIVNSKEYKECNKYNPLWWLLPKTYADDTKIPKDLKVSKWKIRVYKTSNNNLINASLEWNNRWHLVTVYDKQIKVMKKYWYSKTRILDLLALRSMECNLQNWKCKWLNNSDIWPFQINNIHTENYNKSLELWNNEEKLFEYQLKVANDLLNSYEKNFCWEKHFKAIWKTYNNEERFKCYARCFNWWYNRVSYAKRWLVQREIVKYFYNNDYKN